MEDLDKKPRRKYRVHRILAHSYVLYFVLFLVGVWLDIVFRFKVFSGPAMMPVGFSFLIFASLLILWSQMTSRNLDIENLSRESFRKGPYCYTRHPTYLGLFVLMLGFGIIANALFVFLFTLIYFLLVRLIFLKKEEAVLTEKYGTPYLEYKKLVKF